MYGGTWQFCWQRTPLSIAHRMTTLFSSGPGAPLTFCGDEDIEVEELVPLLWNNPFHYCSSCWTVCWFLVLIIIIVQLQNMPCTHCMNFQCLPSPLIIYPCYKQNIWFVIPFTPVMTRLFLVVVARVCNIPSFTTVSKTITSFAVVTTIAHDDAIFPTMHPSFIPNAPALHTSSLHCCKSQLSCLVLLDSLVQVHNKHLL